MGSGEADWQRAGRSLDFFRRCEVDGCLWQVHLPELRCADHGGTNPGPEYASGSEGDILATRHFTWSDDFNGDAA